MNFTDFNSDMLSMLIAPFVHLSTEVNPSLWPLFILAVLALLAFDLFIFNRKPKEMKIKEALSWSIVWVSLAVGFNIWFAFNYGANLGLQFTTGYLVELSLSVDNLFVMLLIFKSFKVPSKYQHSVLFWGILGAILSRGILILVGVDLVNHFHWMLYIFGAILLISALKFMFETDKKEDVTESWFARYFKKIVPMTSKIESGHFFVKEDGIRKATPLFLVLLVIEATDIIFAVDSVPAVLAITHDAFVAFGSNILALLGLRSLYFVLAEWIDKFRYLKPGLAAILAFVGTKMLIVDFYHIPSWVSLLVIIMVLFTAGLTSWYANKKSILRANSLGKTH